MEKKRVIVQDIFAITKRPAGEDGIQKADWKKIGVAFVNKDGSLNLKFEIFPTPAAETTIQVRARRAWKRRDEAQPEVQPQA